jgi:hypothetical protein
VYTFGFFCILAFGGILLGAGSVATAIIDDAFDESMDRLVVLGDIVLLLDVCHCQCTLLLFASPIR